MEVIGEDGIITTIIILTGTITILRTDGQE
jgi:hypothetical protein